MIETIHTRRWALGATAGLGIAGLALPARAAEVEMAEKPLIGRIWHGKTPAAKADDYTHYIFDAGIKKIAAITGNRGVELLRMDGTPNTEFMVISYWDSIDAVKRFAGEHYTQTHNLPRDPEFLVDMEPTVRHFSVLVDYRAG
jgi:heme-degrading monooxygenase HmoA